MPLLPFAKQYGFGVAKVIGGRPPQHTDHLILVDIAFAGYAAFGMLILPQVSFAAGRTSPLHAGSQTPSLQVCWPSLQAPMSGLAGLAQDRTFGSGQTGATSTVVTDYLRVYDRLLTHGAAAAPTTA